MRGWKAVTALALAIVFVGTSQAQDTATQDDATQADLQDPSGLEGACAGAAPPCGYIVPIMDLEFPEKPKCGSGQLSFSDGPPEDCLAVMPKGESKELAGVLRWYWEVSEDGTYPKNTGENIVITFGGTATNPQWLDVEISCGDESPCEFVIDDYELTANNENYELRGEPGQQTLWYVYERPITVTFTRTADPEGPDFDRIEQRGGIVPLFVKAKSSSSEPRFKEAFGVEEFRFNGCTDEDMAAQVSACGGAPLSEEEGKDSPGLPMLGVAAALAAAVAARRRT